MILKLKADEFLQSIVAMRDNAVREAIQQAIQKNHEPYRVQMVAKRDKELADKETRTIFGGRLAEYRYYDMHHIIEQVLNHPEL